MTSSRLLRLTFTESNLSRFSFPIHSKYFCSNQNHQKQNAPRRVINIFDFGKFCIAAYGAFYAHSEWKSYKERLNDEQARQILNTCINERFEGSRLLGFEESHFVERNPKEIPSMDLIHQTLDPHGMGAGVYLFTGARAIGKTTLVQMVYNQIKSEDGSSRIIMVQFGTGLSAFAEELNAYPQESYHQLVNDEEILLSSCERLTKQLRNTKRGKSSLSVLVLDDIRQIPRPLFDKFAARLKVLVDEKLLKVVFVASDGDSVRMVRANPDLASRLLSSHRVDNYFGINDISTYLRLANVEMDETDPRYPRLLKRIDVVSGGRIGYIEVICALLHIESLRKKDIYECSNEDMIRYLYDTTFRAIIEKAFRELIDCGIPSNVIDSIIFSNLPARILRLPEQYLAKVTRILEDANIIYQNKKAGRIEFECTAIGLIFSETSLLQQIRRIQFAAL